MIATVFNFIVSIGFCAFLTFGGVEFYKFIKVEAVKNVHHGLSPTYDLTKKMTGKTFDWENGRK